MSYDYDRKLPPRGTARRPPPPSVARPSPASQPAATSTTPTAAQPATTCQARFLNELVGKYVAIESLGGVERTGTLKHHDMFTLIIEIEGVERLLWKHALTGICLSP